MFNGSTEISAQDLAVVSSVQLMALGTVAVTPDRRIYRYGKAGATQINLGNLAVAEATVANHTNLAVAADAPAGSTSITVTLGATAATQDQYTEGLVTFNAGTGAGYQARIKGHGAAVSSGSLQLFLDTPLAVAITAASTKASLAKNPWKDVIVSTTISKPVGVPEVNVPATNFGWFQTQGLSGVLSGAAIAKGLTVSQSGAGAGAIVATAAATSQVVGVTPEAAVSGEYRNIDLYLE